MRKQYYLIGFILLTILFFNTTLTCIIASGEVDDDGIDNNFEEKNKRNIEISIDGNEVGIESVRRTETNKDEIRGLIFFDEDGLYIGLRYRSNLDAEYILEFGILFHEIVEYIDTNSNNLYEPEIDEKIKEFPLNDFKPVTKESSNLSSDTLLHYLKIQTVNNTFTAHIYFVEEFAIIENSLITPTQSKIDIQISNYDFFNESSHLALHTKLIYEGNFEDKAETADEKDGYAEHETGVITALSNYIGFFSWNNNATINEISQKIYVSELFTDKFNEYDQGLFINYPNAEQIYHNNKIGIEGLLIPLGEQDSLITLIILLSVIGAVSASAAYTINYFTKQKKAEIKIKKDRDAYFKENFYDDPEIKPFDGNLALQILLGENSTFKLSQYDNINITAISDDFIETVNLFDWEPHERSEFVLEMLALPPIERQSILEEMINKTFRIRT